MIKQRIILLSIALLIPLIGIFAFIFSSLTPRASELSPNTLGLVTNTPSPFYVSYVYSPYITIDVTGESSKFDTLSMKVAYDPDYLTYDSNYVSGFLAYKPFKLAIQETNGIIDITLTKDPDQLWTRSQTFGLKFASKKVGTTGVTLLPDYVFSLGGTALTNYTPAKLKTELTILPIPAPVIRVFKTQPEIIKKGEKAMLVVTDSYSTNRTITPDVGILVNNTDATYVNPEKTTTYTLTSSGLGGTTTQTYTLVVEQPPTPTSTATTLSTIPQATSKSSPKVTPKSTPSPTPVIAVLTSITPSPETTSPTPTFSPANQAIQDTPSSLINRLALITCLAVAAIVAITFFVRRWYLRKQTSTFL
ncbi:MAG TPA: hypothetical protein VGE59_03470 [Patescibacteria group bacterium]